MKEHVRNNAEASYQRLSDGSMPCGRAWPAKQVQEFRAWMDGGYPREARARRGGIAMSARAATGNRHQTDAITTGTEPARQHW